MTEPKRQLPSADLVRAVGREAQGAHETAKLIVAMLTEDGDPNGPSVTEQIVALLEQVITAQRQQSVLLESIASDVASLKAARRPISGAVSRP